MREVVLKLSETTGQLRTGSTPSRKVLSSILAKWAPRYQSPPQSRGFDWEPTLDPCAACEPKSYIVHDGNHIFFKLPRHVERPIRSPFPFVPHLLIVPDIALPVDAEHPDAYLLAVQHPATLCDGCAQRICGKWYRCVFCPTDLCADCEAVDSHDNSHLFVVFKSSVEIRDGTTSQLHGP
ncbi:hypothetical protein AURDEDRAFT_163643 [Auricularia subglabra TFB-10046 SS5]|nr:hypothetical protein AURDEDRAFT_163643 [Auricularia subglabra TFB-10046 SS5]